MKTPARVGVVIFALAVWSCSRGPAPRANVAPLAVPAAWPHPLDAPEVSAAHAMIVTDAPIASRVGANVLRSGGSAVDAAVAAAFALAVTLPSAGNLGGGGFAVTYVGGQPAALDFRETAPAAASRNMFLDEHGASSDRSITVHLAAGVPGSVAGLWGLHRKFGTKPWAALVEPAIQLA